MKVLPCAKRWNYPSVDLSTRMIRTCCRAYGPVATREEVKALGKNIFLNHPYMQKGREQMLKGEYQFDCRTCYETADGFQTSYPETLKQLAGTFGETESELDQNFKKSPYNLKYLTAHSARELEVNFGNACDLMCVYCSSAYSSLIEAEDRKYHGAEPMFKQSAIEKNDDLLAAFWQWIEEDALHSLKSIHLIGGETLFNDYLYTFLTRLDGIYKKKGYEHEIHINVFSNLNNTSSVTRFTNTVLQLHPKFHVKILFSNEALGKKAEFIRYGMNWDRSVANIKKILDAGRIELGFAPAFNSLSVSSAADYLKFIHDLSSASGRKFYCGNNYIPFPYAYSPLILTKQFIPFVDEALGYITEHGRDFLIEESVSGLTQFFTTLRKMLLSNSDENEGLQNKRIDFARRIKTLIERRNVDFASAFPEFEEFCGICEGLEP